MSPLPSLLYHSCHITHTHIPTAAAHPRVRPTPAETEDPSMSPTHYLLSLQHHFTLHSHASPIFTISSMKPNHIPQPQTHIQNLYLQTLWTLIPKTLFRSLNVRISHLSSSDSLFPPHFSPQTNLRLRSPPF